MWIDLVAELTAGFTLSILALVLIATGNYSGAIGMVVGFLFGVGWGRRQIGA